MEMRKHLTRRNVLVGGAVVAGGAVLLNRSSDNSGPRDPYFTALQSALFTAGVGSPSLIIDLARLNDNIDALVKELPDGIAHRIPSKSLPSHPLLNHIMAKAGSDRMMTFHWQMLLELSKTNPEIDQLIGKPMPVAAMKSYYDGLPIESKDAAKQVQWLVDTPERLKQYSKAAEGLGADIRVNLELDVGLHRGGFDVGDDLLQTLKAIDANDRLTFSGFMGYEPHIPAMPKFLGMQGRAKANAFETYSNALKMAADVSGEDSLKTLTRNAAGSPTFRLYKDTSITNDVTVGTGLVKPLEYDTELLEIFKPACFIGAPVLKKSGSTRIPGLEFASGIQTFMNPNLDNSVFIYGGDWNGLPVDPPGMEIHSLFGHSPNQAMLNGGSQLDIEPDDFVFFRPFKSEAVFLQFGDILVYDQGKIVDAWPVFPATA